MLKTKNDQTPQISKELFSKNSKTQKGPQKDPKLKLKNKKSCKQAPHEKIRKQTFLKNIKTKKWPLK